MWNNVFLNFFLINILLGNKTDETAIWYGLKIKLSSVYYLKSSQMPHKTYSEKHSALSVCI